MIFETLRSVNRLSKALCSPPPRKQRKRIKRHNCWQSLLSILSFMTLKVLFFFWHFFYGLNHENKTKQKTITAWKIAFLRFCFVLLFTVRSQFCFFFLPNVEDFCFRFYCYKWRTNSVGCWKSVAKQKLQIFDKNCNMQRQKLTQKWFFNCTVFYFTHYTVRLP